MSGALEFEIEEPKVNGKMSHRFRDVAEICGMDYQELIDELLILELVKICSICDIREVLHVHPDIGFKATMKDPLDESQSSHARMWDEYARDFVKTMTTEEKIAARTQKRANERAAAKALKAIKGLDPWPEMHNVSGVDIRCFYRDGVRMTVAADLVAALNPERKGNTSYLVNRYCGNPLKIDKNKVRFNPKIRYAFFAINDEDVIRLTGIMWSKGFISSSELDELEKSMGLVRHQRPKVDQ